MYPAFLVGAYLYTHKEYIEEHSLSIFFVSLISYLVLFSFDDYKMFSYPVLRLHQYLLSPEIGLYLSVQAYFIALGISGTLTVISLFIGTERILNNKKSRHRAKIGEYMSRWGSQTLGIYLIQAILLEHLMMKTLNFSHISWNLFNLVIAPIISILVVILCLTIVHWMRKNSFLRIYFLGENK